MSRAPFRERGTPSRRARVLALFLLCFLFSLFCLPPPARAGITGNCYPAPSNGLVGWWKLDDGSGLSATDSTGGGHTGTLQAAASWTTVGKINGALTFDGTSQKIDVSNMTGLPKENDPQTLSVWFKFANVSDISSGGGLMQLSNLSSNKGTNLRFVCCSGTLSVTKYDGTNLAVGSTPTANVWHLATYTWDGTTNMLYIDGVQIGTSTTAPDTAISTVLYIGDDTSTLFKGTIDDARVYNRALSAAEVAQIYNNDQPGDMLYNQQWRTVQYCDGGNWVATAPQQYAAPGVMFDGSTAYLTKNSNLSGVSADTGLATGSFWFRRLGNFGTAQTIFRANSTGTYNDAHSRYLLEFNTSNQLHIRGADSSGTPTILVDATTAATFTDSNWHHVVYSFDLSNAAKRYIYVDGSADAATWGFYVSGNINMKTITTPRWSIGANGGGTGKLFASLADFWFVSGTYIDLSSAANRALFYNNGPVYLGSAGATPTGSSPQVFFSGNASTWTNTGNLGTGGVFTINGTLVDDSNTASVSGSNVTSGLVGWWKMDETSGNLSDSSGNANTGTPTGTTSVPGMVGNGRKFNGTSDYVDVANETHFDFEKTNPFTISTWVYRTNNATTNIVVGKNSYSGGELNGYMLFFNASDTLVYFDIGDCAANHCLRQASGTAMSTGVWHHVAVTYDGSQTAAGAHIYLDGASAGQAPVSDTLSLDASALNNNDLLIGDQNSSSHNYFNGLIDEVRVYNRVLSAAEVQQLYLYRNQSCANPVGKPADIRYDSDHHVMMFCDGKNWQAMGPELPGAGGSGCLNPSNNEDVMRYYTDWHAMVYCDGTHWVRMGRAPVATSNGLVGWWKLDDGSGASAADSSGNGNTLTPADGTPTYTASGKIGGAFTFSAASTQDESTSSETTLKLTGSWTASTWFKLASAPASGKAYALLEKDDNFSDANYGLYVDNASGNYGTGVGWAVSYKPQSGTVYTTKYVTALTTGTWYLLTGVYDGTNLTLYLNGIQASASIPGGANNPAPGAGQGFFLGRDQTGTGEYLNGTLDDARVYNRALSASEIWDLYLATGGT